MKRGALAASLVTVLLLVRSAAAQPSPPDVLPKEFACMAAHTKQAAKFLYGKTKCVGKCLGLFWAGLVPESDCRTASSIDRHCDESSYPDSLPDCGFYPSGAIWASLVEQWVEGEITPTFCASPSVAFLDRVDR